MQHSAFAIEPWAVRETELHLDVLAQTESVFALANGHVGQRGNLDEGEPFGLPGTYLNAFYELRPLPYAEPGYGTPESGQTASSVRLVSLTQRAVAAILYEVEAVDGLTPVVVQSELVANESLPAIPGDLHAAPALDSPLQSGGLIPAQRTRRAPVRRKPRAMRRKMTDRGRRSSMRSPLAGAGTQAPPSCSRESSSESLKTRVPSNTAGERRSLR